MGRRIMHFAGKSQYLELSAPGQENGMVFAADLSYYYLSIVR
jgi:hypothetical protein